MNDNLDILLEKNRPTLSQEERASMLCAIEEMIAVPVPSPYASFFSSKIMTALLIALMFTVGASGTVLASDNARPGDLLFPIERAREQTQLLLADDAREAELRTQFTAERLVELREIINEERISSSDDTSTSTSVDSEGEVRIGSAVQVLLDYLESVEDVDDRGKFLNELIVEIDAIKVAGRPGDDSSSFDDSRLRVEDDRIEVREDGYRIRIESDGEIRIKEDDDSRDDDNSSDDTSDDSRSSNSSSSSFQAEADVFFDTTIVEVEINDKKTIFETSADTRDEVIDEIVSRYGIARMTVSAVLDFEIEDRASRVDDGDEKEAEDNSGDNSDDDDRSDDSDNRTGIKKFEVRVKDGETEVRIEYGNDKKLEYETGITSQSAIVADVSARTGLSTTELLAALDLEIDN